MSTRHAAVWLDHEQARVFHVSAEGVALSELHPTHHLHHPNKRGGHADLHRSAAEDHPFFDEIARHLADAEEILVVGPAGAKLDFVKFVNDRHKEIGRKIVGVEPSDHPTNGELIAHVRKYFLAADRAQP